MDSVGRIVEMVQRLREAGSTGLDLSPGDPLCIEAADEIERLSDSGNAIDGTIVGGTAKKAFHVQTVGTEFPPRVTVTNMRRETREYVAEPDGEREAAIQKVATDAANYLSRVAGNDGEAAEILLDIQEFILVSQKENSK